VVFLPPLNFLLSRISLLLFCPCVMDKTISDGSIEEVPGATLLDGFLQSFFLGLVLAQATKYWADFRDDSWRKRVFVAVVVVLSM